MTTFLRDVIDIPEHAGANDFVLRLTEGVDADRLAATVAEYVVTADLVQRFDDALALISESIRDGLSRAAYLNGSFGSGKSHFMAVLHGIVGHHPAAWAVPELAPVLASHGSRIRDKRFLRLAFHFVDARSVDEVIFKGYLAQIRALHPDAPLPAIHQSDALLADADALRERMGDVAFFAALNGTGDAGPAEGDQWGVVLDDEMTPATYEAAREPGSPARLDLVSRLTSTLFTSYTRTAEFVPLDEGLHAICAHAKSLGYDAIVAFLDELVLWLMFRVRDTAFFGREVQKLTKLVEGGSGIRPVPLVSFIARQVDLGKYFAEAGEASGSEIDAITQAFTHQAGRFRDITLSNDNLPFVAQKRLLAPRDAASLAALDAAFQRLDRRPDIWNVLLDGENTDDRNRGASAEAFRRTYPFSPALISTLQYLAAAMQRDRTALKVMQALLVGQRAQLTVDHVIPVGDIYDLVVQGNQGQAVSPELAGQFRSARQLYSQRLRPLLLTRAGLTDEQARTAPTASFLADDRLAKTLLLSALAPQVPALRDLTASRLAALNHGSIVSMIDGEEATEVLARIREWAGHIPEIHISGDRNPVIRLQIAEVDYESIVAGARSEDNPGRRRELIKAMVWRALGIPAGTAEDVTGVTRKPVIWRGSRREIEVVFGNIRDTAWLPDERFEATSGTWRFVVDYPFDEQGRGAHDDLARLDTLRTTMSASTVAWVPYFLSPEREDQLGRLVILNYLLSENHFTSHAQNLQPGDRDQARLILSNQRDNLTQRLERAVQEAYGATTATTGTLIEDPGHDRVLISLDAAFVPRTLVGANLEAAFGHLVDQVLRHSFPLHPEFQPDTDEVRAKDAIAVLNAVDAALQAPDGRTPVDGPHRAVVRRVANPLQLGRMGETHYVFTADGFAWEPLIGRAMAGAGLDDSAPVSTAQLRRWISGSRQAGLSPVVTDLVILAWARLHNRAPYWHGAPLSPAPVPGRLENSVEFRAQAMPTTQSWTRAVAQAAALFGLTVNPHLTATSLTGFDAEVRDAARRVQAGASQLRDAVLHAYQRVAAPTGAAGGRLATAVAASDLATGLVAAAGPVALVQLLATTTLPATPQTVAMSLSSAPAVASAIRSFSWPRVDRLTAEATHGERAGKAEAILRELREAVVADEFTRPLAPALARADSATFDFFAAAPSAPPPPPPPPLDPEHAFVLQSAADVTVLDTRLRALLADHPDREVRVTWEVLP